MNIVEFLGRNIENFIYKDSYGNLYLDAAALPVGQELSEIMGYGCSDYYYLTAEEYRGYSEYQILAEAEKEKFLSVENTRRPYYRMRGKRLTENQAFEIIRRTDTGAKCCDIKRKKGSESDPSRKSSYGISWKSMGSFTDMKPG